MIKPFKIVFTKMSDGNPKGPREKKRKCNWYSPTQELQPRPMAFVPPWLKRILYTGTVIMPKGPGWQDVELGKPYLVEIAKTNWVKSSVIWVRILEKLEEENGDNH